VFEPVQGHFRFLAKGVLLATALTLAACDPFTTAHGRVVDSAGRPLAGATVTLAHGDYRESQQTDSVGRFELGFPWSGGRAEGSVTACKRGFTLVRVDFVAPDTAIGGLELVLAPRTGPSHPLCP
jgi:hypothetical protein